VKLRNVRDVGASHRLEFPDGNSGSIWIVPANVSPRISEITLSSIELQYEIFISSRN
jgi:hypothetical protein